MIREQLAPFSRRPGVRLLIPGTTEIVQVFPTRLVFADREEELPGGPYSEFLVVQDLEKLEVRIFCDRKLRHTIVSPAQPVGERLSFGSHKKQDWDQMVRRMDPAEILPVWHRLGSLMPPTSGALDGDLMTLFRVHFGDLMVPHAEDVHHWGHPALVLESMQLLRLGYDRIRGSILQGNEVVRPPHHCGRLVGAAIEGGMIDLEWSKKLVRRVVLDAEIDGEVTLTFPKEIRSFRVRGERLDAGTPIPVSRGEQIHLDQFRK